jgi:putative membrane protein
MEYIFVKYIHFAGLLLLVSTLALEHFLVKPKMSPDEFRKLALVDMIYGISSLIVLAAGLTLWFVVGKGASFYTANPIFHIKLSLFVLVGLLSVYPTVFFIRNRTSTQTLIEVPAKIVMIIRTELLLVFVIPLLAVLMAQGVGRH